MTRVLLGAALLWASCVVLSGQPRRVLLIEDHGDAQRGFTLARYVGGTSALEASAPLTAVLGAQAQLTLVAANVTQSLATVRNEMANADAWFSRHSWGSAWLEPNDVVGKYAVAMPAACDYWSVAERLRAKAKRAGIRLDRYRRFLYLADLPCSWWGIATVGGTNAWVDTSKGLRLRVVAHEIGHNFGLPHSRSLNLLTGAVAEYGDNTDVMGSSGSGSYGPYGKTFIAWLGWDAMPPVTETTAPGIYRIATYDAPFDGMPRALRVPFGMAPSAHYFARRAKGVYVYRVRTDYRPYQLVGAPLVGRVLPVGVPYPLLENGRTVTVIAQDAQSATLMME